MVGMIIISLCEVCSAALLHSSISDNSDLMLKVVHTNLLASQLVLLTFGILVYYPNQEVDSFLQTEVVNLYVNNLFRMPLEENDPKRFCVYVLDEMLKCNH